MGLFHFNNSGVKPPEKRVTITKGCAVGMSTFPSARIEPPKVTLLASIIRIHLRRGNNA